VKGLDHLAVEHHDSPAVPVLVRPGPQRPGRTLVENPPCSRGAKIRTRGRFVTGRDTVFEIDDGAVGLKGRQLGLAGRGRLM